MRCFSCSFYNKNHFHEASDILADTVRDLEFSDPEGFWLELFAMLNTCSSRTSRNLLVTSSDNVLAGLVGKVDFLMAFL